MLHSSSSFAAVCPSNSNANHVQCECSCNLELCRASVCRQSSPLIQQLVNSNGLPGQLEQKPCAQWMMTCKNPSSSSVVALSRFVLPIKSEIKFKDLRFGFRVSLLLVSNLKLSFLNLVGEITIFSPQGSRPSNFDGGRKDAATNEKQSSHSHACEVF